ncbi:MAG TPA: DUF2306 domain-containing protein [Caulobacteraceae bacterium]|jgi:hypothetical protein
MTADAISLPRTGISAALVRYSGTALLVSSWISAAIFGLYILAFYIGAIPRDAMSGWNHTLPGLYEPRTPMATLAIGGHFLAGAILLMLGPVQFIRAIRSRVPAVHRWLGRLYVLSAGVAGVAGLSFIVMKGTVGGPVMSVGFGLYGALVALSALQTYRYGLARNQVVHSAWATRLFALVIGSWLYRLEYGFWVLTTGGLGSTNSFSGWFDHVMAFFFYLPNLAIAEMVIRSNGRTGSALRYATAVTLALATGLVVLGSYFFITRYWWPGIVAAT